MENPSKGLTGNKTRTYLLYAIGEILLVVVGILIALQVNNWNEERSQRTQETVYLQLILDDLLLQKEENEKQKNALLRLVSKDEELSGYIRNRFKVSEDQREKVKYAISTLFIGRTYGAFEATFLDLTSSGNIALISNSILKNRIIQHYQIQRRDLDVINNNSRNNYQELWSKMVGRDLVVLPLDMDILIDGMATMEFDPALNFLDDGLFEKLSGDDNLTLIQNVVAYRKIGTNVAVRFIDRSDRRIDDLVKAINLEMEGL